MLAARTDKQKDSQDAYMEKLQDIKVRVPKEYYDKIKSYAESKGLSINKLVISLLEKEIGERILSIREKNKLEKGTEQKRPLDFSNGLLYNLIRKVYRMQYPIALSKLKCV